MEHFIIGTAGHIDHGKTSLIKALTNIECDTHPEEKKRGITINLGFAYIKREDGEYMAFVDVPGHHKFISNMVAGAAGIDFVMLVVAANDGIMPQTKEHLKICSLLGIKSGIVVINKCDAVDSEEIELCTEEVEDFVKGTFLEGKPIFNVSALSGEGIETLRNYLINGDYSVNRRAERDFFRMAIDRTFNVSGFGVVVTGTVAQSSISIGDNLTLLPKGLKAKVRGVQRHAVQVEKAEQGTRVAIDLTGMKREDVTMGDILCELPLISTKRIDVILSVMNELDETLTKFDAVMLCGTTKISVKVKIIERYIEDNELKASAQIDLPKEWYFTVGEYFILRNSSSDHTIAGGQVVDPFSLNHRKITPQLKEQLRNIGTSAVEYIERKVYESVEMLHVDIFEQAIQLKASKLKLSLENSTKVVLFPNGYILSLAKIEEFITLITEGYKKYLKSNPLSVIGVSRKTLMEFAKGFSLYISPKSNEEALSMIFEKIERDGIMIRSGNNWRLPGMRSEINEREKNNIAKVENLFKDYGFSPMSLTDIFSDSRAVGIEERDAKHIITYLTELKRIVRVEDMFMLAESLTEARNRLISYLKEHPEGIKTAEYRDIMGINRKVAVILLEQFDKEKIVVRIDDVRTLV